MPQVDNSSSKPDGRRMRSNRSRQLIIASMLELIKQGNLVPTAQQVADHANVGIRSVFRHFEDMESIFETANELLHREYRGLFIGGDRSGKLQERILHATECHANAYETMSNMILSSAARRWNSKVLQKSYVANQHQLRKDLDEWLPELENLSESKRQAVDGIASFEMWHRLRNIQSLSKTDSIEIIVEMLEALIC
ncbi:MAG: TetR/AcrR family transcriptional regulator [Porticoccaceae bacterium]|nr:TetR/AcrR family transcriptional regulator [Porticoccaceae bacterium]